jgi:hypothetical protein
MPIRINLLAEAQAAEELRRKDPVKRTIWGGVVAVCVVLVWSSSLQVKVMTQNGKLNGLEAALASRTNTYQQVLKDKKKLAETTEKMGALTQLATNRFLQGQLLDALQHATVDGIQLTRVKIEQSYDVTPATKAADNKPAKPGKSVEKIMLILEAKDTSANPGGDQVNKFKETLAQNPYFKARNVTTNEVLLKNLATPQLDQDTGKPFVQFTFECKYPDKTR